MDEKRITVHPRRLARQMARAEFDRAGVTGYNKPTMDATGTMNGPSKFSCYWRKTAATVAGRKSARKKKH
jgi:hypothetical protein